MACNMDDAAVGNMDDATVGNMDDAVVGNMDNAVVGKIDDAVVGNMDNAVVDSDEHMMDINKPMLKYGELVILGHNGSLPKGDHGRMRSKFVLYQRTKANGVTRSNDYIVKSSEKTKAILDPQQYSISYALAENEAVIVEYKEDADTDMFQIGRSNEPPIDFVVIDNKAQLTTSRYACRILIERNEAPKPKIYAAGFDSSRNIFLGKKAAKWHINEKIDGLTTNGVLILHPNGEFCGGNAETRVWRECSVGGDILNLRQSRSSLQEWGDKIQNETNVLIDGTLIDLCGVILLWRSAEGLKSSPAKEDLEKLVDKVNAGRPHCSIVIPRTITSEDQSNLPYVYLNCGHVEIIIKGQNTLWERKCPKCRKVGPLAPLCMGIETAFYVDSGPANFAFNPCGHMTTEKTVKYWARVDVPHGTNGFQAVCPFCATPVEETGYVKLIF